MLTLLFVLYPSVPFWLKRPPPPANPEGTAAATADCRTDDGSPLYRAITTCNTLKRFNTGRC